MVAQERDELKSEEKGLWNQIASLQRERDQAVDEKGKLEKQTIDLRKQVDEI